MDIEYPSSPGNRMEITPSKRFAKANNPFHQYSNKQVSNVDKHLLPQTASISELRRPKRQKTKGLAFSSTSRKPTYQDPLEVDSKQPSDQKQKPQNSSLSIIDDASATLNCTTIKTRILLLSDTHGISKFLEELLLEENNCHLPEESSPKRQKIDVVIHTGDLSNSGSLTDYRASLALLSSIPAELKLVIPGNHDLTLDKEFWEKHSTMDARELSAEAERLFERKKVTNEEKGEAWKGKGVILLENGIHEFRLGNGGMLRVYAGAGTPFPDGDGAGMAWAFGHPSNTDIYNPPGRGISYAATTTAQSQTLIPDNANLDIIMTHGPQSIGSIKDGWGLEVLKRLLWAAHISFEQ